jgi:hypothetical protein
VTDEQKDDLIYLIAVSHTDSELCSIGLTLAAIACCRHGETLLESQQQFRHMAMKTDEKIKYHWDQLRQMEQLVE